VSAIAAIGCVVAFTLDVTFNVPALLHHHLTPDLQQIAG